MNNQQKIIVAAIAAITIAAGTAVWVFGGSSSTAASHSEAEGHDDKEHHNEAPAKPEAGKEGDAHDDHGEEDEAVAIANDSPFALAAGVWTRNLGRAHRVASQIDTGTVWVNMYRALQFATPFGGNKLSGYGRENGMDGFAEFTQPKGVWVESSDEPVGDPFILRA